MQETQPGLIIVLRKTREECVAGEEYSIQSICRVVVVVMIWRVPESWFVEVVEKTRFFPEI